MELNEQIVACMKTGKVDTVKFPSSPSHSYLHPTRYCMALV